MFTLKPVSGSSFIVFGSLKHNDCFCGKKLGFNLKAVKLASEVCREVYFLFLFQTTPFLVMTMTFAVAVVARQIPETERAKPKYSTTELLRKLDSGVTSGDLEAESRHSFR